EKNMSALVRYGKPIELRLQPRTDLRTILSNVINDAATRETGGLPRAQITTDVTSDKLLGEFDPAALTEALKAVTDELRANAPAKDAKPLSLEVKREINGSLSEALIEWRGGRITKRNRTFP